MQFSWSPRQKVAAEGSVSVNGWDNFDLGMKMTTPFRAVRSVGAQLTHKAEGSALVGQMVLDLGMRKDVALTTRVQRDLSGVRAKLVTPWDAMRVMDAGFQAALQGDAGKVTADFKAVPMVSKYEAAADWTLGDDMTLKARLNTPHPQLPYVQVNTYLVFSKKLY